MSTPSHRLVTRVTLIFSVAIAALLVILAASFALIVYENQRTTTAALERELAQRAAVTIGAHLDSLRSPLIDTARLRPNLLQAVPDDQRATLDGLLAQGPSYLELALVDDRGNVTANATQSGPAAASVNQDPDRLAALQAAQAQQAYLGHVHLTENTQEPYVAIGEPLPAGQGALVAWIDLRHVWDIVSSVRVGDSGYAYVLDSDGYLIAYRDAAPILARDNPVRTNEGLWAHLLVEGGVGEYDGLNGEPVIGSHAPISSTSWIVVVETPLSEAYTVLYRALGLVGVLLLVGILIAAMTARYLATRFLDPVELLREGAALIGAGHLDHKIVIDTGDEIEELAGDFNRMTQNLLRARMELEDWARELERRVQEETTQVVEQKERLAVLEERQRMARELHDSITEALFTLTLTLESAQAFSKKDPARVPALLDRSLEIAKAALGDTRALISDLRPSPLEHRGLAEALRDRLAEIASGKGIAIDLKIEGESPLTPECQDAVYRIALEAVNNAANHARPTRIEVNLAARDNAAVLTVSDDGSGFDSKADFPGHYGLQTMRERARALGGSVTIASQIGQGTTVRAEIPAAKAA
jgi:signal transduction histidine kinase